MSRKVVETRSGTPMVLRILATGPLSSRWIQGNEGVFGLFEDTKKQLRTRTESLTEVGDTLVICVHTERSTVFAW